MSQVDPEPIVKVFMLPPSFAVYLRGVLIIPVLIRLQQGNEADPHLAHVAPVVIAHNTASVYWYLVLLNDNSPVRWVEFKTLPIEFKNTHDEVVSAPGNVQIMSTTQIKLGVATPPLNTAICKYDLHFHIRQPGAPSPVGQIRVPITMDPAVSITEDPVDIPTWP